MASPHERQGALQPVVDAARSAVADLTARVSAARNRARERYAAADQPGGDSAHAEALALQAELSAAEQRAATLAEAAAAVARERQRADDQEKLRRLTAGMADAADESHRQLATVAPALSAAKQALRLARQAEDLARSLDVQRNQLQAHLDAGPERATVMAPPYRSPYGKVAKLIEADRLVRELLNDTGY